MEIIHPQRQLGGIHNLVFTTHACSLHHVRFKNIQQGALHELGNDTFVIRCCRIGQHKHNMSKGKQK